MLTHLRLPTTANVITVSSSTSVFIFHFQKLVSTGLRDHYNHPYDFAFTVIIITTDSYHHQYCNDLYDHYLPLISILRRVELLPSDLTVFKFIYIQTS